MTQHASVRITTDGRTDACPMGSSGVGPLAAHVRRVAEHIAAGRRQDASEALEDMVGRASNPADAGEGLSVHLFAASLGRKIGRRLSTRNLYLRDFNVSQISLFNLVSEKLPPVRYAGMLAKELIAGFIADRDEAKLFDIGIGTARQEVAVLRELSRRGRAPRRLHIVALEPNPSILEAQRNLRLVAKEVGVEIVVRPVAKLAEALRERDWDQLREHIRGGVVNAAFAVHHVRGLDTASARDALFRKLRAQGTSAIVLAEPNAGHVEPDFATRAENCARHFGKMFELIDRLSLRLPERAVMKLFFARELDDIIANDESTRAERHEWTTTWLHRLQSAGFTAVANLPFTRVAFDHGFSIEPNIGHTALQADRETLVSVIGAVTAGASLEQAGWINTRPSLRPPYLQPATRTEEHDRSRHRHSRSSRESNP